MSEHDYETIRIEHPAEHLGAIVLDRPDAMNAISGQVLEDLDAAIDALESDDDARTIMVRGAGDDAFSVGADVQSTGPMPHREAVEHSRKGQHTFGRLRALDKPVVAAIDGHCLGGGLELSMCADLRVASEGSQFGLPEHDLGLLPGWGGTQRLQRLIGESRAKQVVFTADRFDAETVADWGFVHEVYGDDEFDDRAVEFAADVAAGPPISQRYTKRAMRKGWADMEAGLELEAQAFGHLLDTDDFAEGISAFTTGRDPEFEGE